MGGSISCSAALRYGGAPGFFLLWVQCFDRNNGVSGYRLWVRNKINKKMEFDLQDSLSERRKQLKYAQ
ncbi:MAG: hypothetical protein ABSH28_25140 [Acidobacteriota bacterium]|jgi:hypothetical protein